MSLTHLATSETNPLPRCGIIPPLDDYLVLPTSAMDPDILLIDCLECAAIVSQELSQG